ncbi:hypothetical protein MMC13_006157 [Lambiella insularis]|nr:hypothetical protein [Lambiella insularis]
MPKREAGENSKKAAGNAKKAEAAAQKSAAESAKKSAVEDAEWSKGAKSTAKKEQDAAKREEAARKKAEKDALLAEEEKSARTTPKGANAKTAVKKTTRGLDLAQLDDAPTAASKTAPALNASNIDDALDALSISTSNPNAQQIDRHPERRYKAAYAAYEARRLPEVEEEMKGLRRQQRIDLIRKEFEKSPDNPFNQISARFDSTRDEVKQIRQGAKDAVEGRLTAKS